VEIIRRLSQHTAVRYVFVGGTSFAVEMSSLLALYYGLHFSLTAATSIAYWIGLLLAFGLQKVVAFRDKRRELHILTWQAALFGVLTLFNWGFTVAFVGLFPAGSIILTRPLAQVIFASWNYFLYKNIIFN
jgi:putative flippase GtrA